MAGAPLMNTNLPRTERSKIYGVPHGQHTEPGLPLPFPHADIENYRPYKSGLTPLAEYSDAQLPRLYRKTLEGYELKRFKGFTTDELEQMQSLTFKAYDWHPGIIDDDFNEAPLHPIFAPEHWQSNIRRFKHLPAWPLGDGRPGFWEASNDTVWKLMLPSLKLASMFLRNAHMLPWWDALLFAPNESVAPTELEIKDRTKPRYRVSFRTQSQSLRSEGKMLALLNETMVNNRIDFTLFCGYTNSESGLRGNKLTVAHTWKQEPWRRTTINLSFHLLEPLLHPNLRIGDRLATQFIFAVNLLSELAQGLAMIDSKTGLYFEKEPIAHIALSMQNHIFGGTYWEINSHIDQYDHASGGFYQRGWPRQWAENVTDKSNPILRNKPADYVTDIYWPIPYAYYAEIQKPAYWHGHVSQFGSEGAKMGPKTKGTVYTNPAKYPKSYLYKLNSSHRQVAVVKTYDRRGRFNNRPQFDAYQLENSRCDRAEEIAEAVQYAKKEREEKAQRDAIDALGGMNLNTTPDPRPPKPPNTFAEASYDKPIDDRTWLRIANHLVRNYQVMRLDTMDFTIPEHQLYSYIPEDSVYPITPPIWRNFLKRCVRENKLFRFKVWMKPPTPTLGNVDLIEEGWPPIPKREKLDEEILGVDADFDAAWDKYAKCMWTSASLFNPGIRDFDLLAALDNLNDVIKVQYQTPRGLSPDLFDRCLQHDIARHQRRNAVCIWDFGPPGILRMIQEKKDS